MKDSDPPKKPLPKAVDPQSELKRDTTITIIGLVLSLPFAICWASSGVMGLVIEPEVLQRSGWVALLFILTLFSFVPYMPGTCFAIAGFVLRRTRLSTITLLVAASPWFLLGLGYLALYFFFPKLLTY